ncbi:hypothetical protein HELRODRAFT_169465 [Helobdella robusta]|uniref:Uncharacterized protein n=1 Tax=Helobdella robusta TaxID=6412 RepID=T1F1Z2_HELRO|nr:hypothetical protein HELRODRAFT_169465 [Helobdella robusta]ESO08591.1 hypothetical protein HELRODRAFT_169465 [Helobdella robusta]
MCTSQNHLKKKHNTKIETLKKHNVEIIHYNNNPHNLRIAKSLPIEQRSPAINNQQKATAVLPTNKVKIRTNSLSEDTVTKSLKIYIINRQIKQNKQNPCGTLTITNDCRKKAFYVGMYINV